PRSPARSPTFGCTSGWWRARSRRPIWSFRPGARTRWWSSAPPVIPSRALEDEDLKEASWIVRERGSGTRQAFDRAMRGLLPQLRIALTLEQTEAIKSAVEQGLGVSCLSRIAVEPAFKGGRLCPCRVPHRDFRRQFFFLLHKDKRRGDALTRWLDLCRSSP